MCVDGPAAGYAAASAARQCLQGHSAGTAPSELQETPEEVRALFKEVKLATAALGLPSEALPGYEADDLIATYSRLAQDEVSPPLTAGHGRGHSVRGQGLAPTRQPLLLYLHPHLYPHPRLGTSSSSY